jgi:exosome complex RNA-binding protein Rrp4
MANEKTVKETTTAEKKVKIRLPLTRTENADVFVAVNGRTWLIKRGETVEVPECVAEVLQHQEEALAKAYNFQSSVVRD